MLCIRNGLLVLPGGVREADLYIRDDKIFSVGGRWADADVIDASGCRVFPGFIGLSPVAPDEAVKGSEAALTGGFTLLPVRCEGELRERMSTDFIRCDDTIYINADHSDELRARLSSAARGEVIPVRGVPEEEILSLAGQGSCIFRVGPIRSREELERVRRARAAGAAILTETDEKCLTGEAVREDREALLEALLSGEIDLVSGAPGTLAARLLPELGKQGGAGLLTAARILSENPARLLGIYPGRGAIRVGSVADLVLWDPEYRCPVSGDELTRRLEGGSAEQSPRGRAKSVLLRGLLSAGRGMVLRYGLGREIEAL